MYILNLQASPAFPDGGQLTHDEELGQEFTVCQQSATAKERNKRNKMLEHSCRR